MDLMQTLREQAAAKPMRVAFPEGENETVDFRSQPNTLSK